MSKLFIHIGTITGVFGIKGELKVKFLLTKPKKIMKKMNNMDNNNMSSNLINKLRGNMPTNFK